MCKKRIVIYWNHFNSIFGTAAAPISFGRTDQCQVRLKNNNISRIQSKYNNNMESSYRMMFMGRNWMLFDGDGLKHSTNGTWLFVDKMFPLYNNLLFKAGDLLFKVVEQKSCSDS